MNEKFKRSFNYVANHLEIFFRWFFIIYIAIAMLMSPFFLMLTGEILLGACG
tara:strand:+ start:1013 stop:1168 length:156 start_codon:yes stop_codon:yes gene_type:complete